MPSNKKARSSPVGLEPTTSGLEVRRAIHCATETSVRCMDYAAVHGHICNMCVIANTINNSNLSRLKCIIITPL